MTVFFQRLSINDIASPFLGSLLPQMYYFVETLSVSRYCKLIHRPPKLADAAHSCKPLQTHQAIHRSLIVVNPNIDRIQRFENGMQHPSSVIGLCCSVCLLLLSFAGIYLSRDTQPAPVIQNSHHPAWSYSRFNSGLIVHRVTTAFAIHWRQPPWLVKAFAWKEWMCEAGAKRLRADPAKRD